MHCLNCQVIANEKLTNYLFKKVKLKCLERKTALVAKMN